MVQVSPEGQPRRMTSPIDRISFVAPLITVGADENVDGIKGTRPSTGSRVLKGLMAGSCALVLGTGLSLTSCQLVSSFDVMPAKLVDPLVLRGMGLKHPSKSWKEYTDEMVDYISARSYASLVAGPQQNSLDPLLSGTFSHFSRDEHGALGALLPNDVQHWADVHWTIAYTQFMDAFNLIADYQDDEQTLLQRFSQYRKNAEMVYSHNRRTPEYASSPEDVEYLYTLELNRFADLSPEDMKSFGYVDDSRAKRAKPSLPVDAQLRADAHLDGLTWNPMVHAIPDEFSWKKEGCVQKVKNQLRCGSCWAFSAVEALESAVCVARKHKNGSLSNYYVPGPVSPEDDDHGDYNQDWVVAPEMPSLSEQQLVDCAAKDGNHGCSGGMMEFAFQYAMENSNGELCEESSYNYEGKEGVCQETACKYDRDWKVTSWNNVTRFSASSLQRAIMSFGTIAVSVEADNPMFMLYKGGIVHDGKAGSDDDEKSCGNALNHGVAVVGWGNDPETEEPYWLVKNSWGPKWGEDGFIRLARDSGGMFGECGILMDASYPIVKAYTHPSH